MAVEFDEIGNLLLALSFSSYADIVCEFKLSFFLPSCNS